MRTLAQNHLIDVRDLSFAYNGTLVLDEISFSVKPGEVVSFVGPSGCGKSTLLALLAGIRPFDRGQINNRSRSPSFMFQEDCLLAWRDCLANVLLPYDLVGRPVNQALRQKALNNLSMVGLEDFASYRPAALSGGMKKRLELARALIEDADLLILDEPFSNLDIITRERLNLLLKQIQQKKGVTIVLVTHSIEEAVFLSDRVFMLTEAPAQIRKTFTVSGGDRPQLATDYVLDAKAASIEREIRLTAKSHHQVNRTGVWRSGGQTPKKTDQLIKQALAFVLGLVFLTGFFSLIKAIFGINDLIYPYPTLVAQRFFETLANGFILPHVAATTFESLAGFLIAFSGSLLTGYLVAKSKTASRFLMPYFIALHAIPTVAIAPLLVTWLGFGYAPRIAVVVIIVFFPALISNIAAVRLADSKIKNLIAFYKPGRWRAFRKLEAPFALPVVFSGVKISITVSVVGAVIGEFVSGDTGLGAILLFAKAYYDMGLLFAALLWLTILSLTYYLLAVALDYLFSRQKGVGKQKTLKSSNTNKGRP